MMMFVWCVEDRLNGNDEAPVAANLRSPQQFINARLEHQTTKHVWNYVSGVAKDTTGGQC